MNGKEGTVEGLLGTEAFKVQITSKTMEGHHYVNPEFDVTLPNGHYKFMLENGKAWPFFFRCDVSYLEFDLLMKDVMISENAALYTLICLTRFFDRGDESFY